MILIEPVDRIDIVAIGVSTGGPKALYKMVPEFPADLGVPVVIVQHMPAVFTKTLATGLNKISKLTVVEGISGHKLKPNTVYIAPGEKQMKLFLNPHTKETALITTDDPPENFCKPSADYLFRSVAQIYPRRALGVILTGMGADGVKGSIAMKKAGAYIIAQDEKSSIVFGMPMEVIKAGAADQIVPLDKVASQITRVLKQYRKLI